MTADAQCRAGKIAPRPAAAILYVLATPIGNLEDLSPRARRILSCVAVVAAEDTRRTAKLLHHVGAHPRLLSYREQNRASAERAILEHLSRGNDVALVSDAGTPAISDPGVSLVRAASRAGFLVVPIVGPSALAAALSVAGISCGSFRFVGFLARSGKRRREEVARIADGVDATVLFESPHRIRDTIAELAEACGPEREAAIARELTKEHEEVVRGSLATVQATFAARDAPVRGEVVLVVAAKEAALSTNDERSLAETYPDETGTSFSDRDLVDQISHELNAPRRLVYAIVNRVRARNRSPGPSGTS